MEFLSNGIYYIYIFSRWQLFNFLLLISMSIQLNWMKILSFSLNNQWLVVKHHNKKKILFISFIFYCYAVLLSMSLQTQFEVKKISPTVKKKHNFQFFTTQILHFYVEHDKILEMFSIIYFLTPIVTTLTLLLITINCIWINR